MIVALLAGCSEIEVEAPDALDTTIQATIEGSIVYVGPRPVCEYDDAGVPLSVPGVVVLTLIDDANPPPPEGTNQSAASMLAISGAELFSPVDCRPANPAEFDPADTLMRSVGFIWPQIALAPAAGQTVSYRVAGFYDQRGDFSPFFTVQSSTTRGDVAGAAVKSTSDPSYDLVTMGNVVDSPLGEVHDGVAVTLGGVVTTEPPMFRVVGGEAMNAALPVPLATTPQAMQTELEASSAFTLRMFGRDLAAGDADDQDLARVLAALREPDPDPADGITPPPLLAPRLDLPEAYAWYHQAIDVDGVAGPDPHPVLGPIKRPDTAAEDVAWLETPVVLLQRVRTAEESRAGVPNVGIQAASPNRNHGAFPTLPSVEYPNAQVIVPPIASVLLNTAHSPMCMVPYMPAGTAVQFYEAREGEPPTPPVECHEIPTGPYGVNVLHGIVGGAVVDDPSSQTALNISGGTFASQVWAVPNAFGDPAQIGDLLSTPEGQAPDVADSQSVARTLHFVDPSPESALGRQDGAAGCFAAPSLELEPAREPVWQGFPEAPGACTDGAPSLEDQCCASVRHLCFVPRCPYEACQPGVVSSPREGMGETRSFSYTNYCGEVVTGRAYFPECVPFYVPSVCCDEIWNDPATPRPAPLTEPFVDPSTCT